MGRGDNRTKKGKITSASYGVSRPKKARNAKAKRTV
ncbi:MAG TPA: 30S ribosomal protein THX [Edaphocola sp.]|nr:30S ribosomal protein THX [Edaphocola sp.]